jgi:hypothetical protein
MDITNPKENNNERERRNICKMPEILQDEKPELLQALTKYEDGYCTEM